MLSSVKKNIQLIGFRRKKWGFTACSLKFLNHLDIFDVFTRIELLSTSIKDDLILQNARFYESFEKKDIRAMGSIWHHGEHVRCIHPGWNILIGWERIRESWLSIFESGTGMRVSLRSVSAEVVSKTGIVTLVEEIVFTNRRAVTAASISATNIFIHEGKHWRMIHHHGSPIAGGKEDQLYRYN